LATRKNTEKAQDQDPKAEVRSISEKVVREVIIPEIEKEVNGGKNFSTLRQIFHSMVLSTWFKRNMKQSLVGQAYTDKNKVVGIDLVEKGIKDHIWKEYVEAFKKGAFNYIKEEKDESSQELIPRKYFAGGYKYDSAAVVKEENVSNAQIVDMAEKNHDGKMKIAAVKLEGADKKGHQLSNAGFGLQYDPVPIVSPEVLALMKDPDTKVGEFLRLIDEDPGLFPQIISAWLVLPNDKGPALLNIDLKEDYPQHALLMGKLSAKINTHRMEYYKKDLISIFRIACEKNLPEGLVDLLVRNLKSGDKYATDVFAILLLLHPEVVWPRLELMMRSSRLSSDVKQYVVDSIVSFIEVGRDKKLPAGLIKLLINAGKNGNEKAILELGYLLVNHGNRIWPRLDMDMRRTMIRLLNAKISESSAEEINSLFWVAAHGAYEIKADDFIYDEDDFREVVAERINFLLMGLGEIEPGGKMMDTRKGLKILNSSVKPFIKYAAYLRTHHMPRDMEKILPEGFRDLSIEQLKELAIRPEAVRQRRAILARLYPDSIKEDGRKLFEDPSGVKAVAHIFDELADKREDVAALLIEHATIFAPYSHMARQVVQASPILDKIVVNFLRIESTYRKKQHFPGIYKLVTQLARDAERTGGSLSQRLKKYGHWQELNIFRPLFWGAAGDHILHNRWVNQGGAGSNASLLGDPDNVAIVIYPTYDHNGAYLNDIVVSKLIAEGRAILYYEVSSVQQMVDAVKDATRNGRKASYLVIGGHGSEEGYLAFEESYKHDALLHRWHPALTPGAFRRDFKAGAQGLLYSCFGALDHKDGDSSLLNKVMTAFLFPFTGQDTSSELSQFNTDGNNVYTSGNGVIEKPTRRSFIKAIIANAVFPGVLFHSYYSKYYDKETGNPLGGIDLNSNQLQLNETGGKINFNGPIDPAMLAQIDGFSPVVLSVTSMGDPQVFFGGLQN
jgi:hypothetical protein